MQKVWGGGKGELKQELPAQTPLKQLFLPGQHPHTHQLFPKTLKWFQGYTSKGITDSIRESISPLHKFTRPKAWAANNQDRWRRNTYHLGLAQHTGISQGNSMCTLEVLQPLPAILSVWSSPSQFAPFPSEQCYRGEQLEEGVLHKTNTRQA